MLGCHLKSADQTTRSNASPIKLAKPEKETISKDALKIAYIGNMGVLLESGDKTILIDGLHEKYKPAYVFPTESMVTELIEGNYSGFTKIEIAMVTHKHGDHFSPKYAATFLDKNPTSLLIGSAQIKAQIGSNKKNLTGRIKVIEYNNHLHNIEHENIQVKAIRCDHSNRQDIKGLKTLLT